MNRRSFFAGLGALTTVPLIPLLPGFLKNKKSPYSPKVIPINARGMVGYLYEGRVILDRRAVEGLII